MRKFVLILLVAFPFVAQAYPWCLMINGMPSCKYVSQKACYSMVDKRGGGGECRVNPREVGARANGAFCVVTATSRNCRYRTKGRCLANARVLKGGCVPNTDKQLKRRASGMKRAMGCFPGEEGCSDEAPELFEDPQGAAKEGRLDGGYDPLY